MFKRFFTFFLCSVLFGNLAFAQDLFPDGTPVPDWFSQIKETNINSLGKQYRITSFGVKKDSNILQTKAIQAVIDKAAADGGGVIIVPKGTFLSGSLFFRPNTHLHLEKGATIKGSSDISDFVLQETRIEGQTLKYFTALVNADKVDGFTISGKGTLNGNGLTYWQHFWLRRAFNPQCTNMDEMRP
ncbi:MAG TPA: exopolygalacturonase, partial [Niabella sp.]|nr:exopolygalacturonase [Niabella sp.]